MLKKKWVDEMLSNLVAVINKRNKDGTKRNNDGVTKKADQDRDNSSANKRTDKSRFSKEAGR